MLSRTSAAVRGEKFLGVPFGRLHTLIPGLAATALLAWGCIRLAGLMPRVPLSAVTLAMVSGLAIANLVPLPAWLKPGVSFSVKKVLRVGRADGQMVTPQQILDAMRA